MNERLKKIREYYGLNTRDFAEKLGMSNGAISLLENGKRNCTAQFIKAVCTVFTEINEEWFKTGKGEMLKPMDWAQEVAKIAKRLLQSDYDDVYARWVKNLSQLSPEELKMLDKLIKKIMKEEKDSSDN